MEDFTKHQRKSEQDLNTSDRPASVGLSSPLPQSSQLSIITPRSLEQEAIALIMEASSLHSFKARHCSESLHLEIAVAISSAEMQFPELL
mmetsp:Transcript_12122/g.18104  ORF Transcript_12122/g.18104 Transcript_12122/m.18104 type:complete len:90 (+) Transcript_12122:442-711(+)